MNEEREIIPELGERIEEIALIPDTEEQNDRKELEEITHDLSFERDMGSVELNDEE